MLPGFFLEICTMRKALSLSAAALVMLVSAKASASFHVMKVVEVFAGSAAAPNASYVQLQMYSGGQTQVSGHMLHVYDATGVEITAAKVTFSANVANGADQANILIGTSSVSAAFGVTPDFTLPQNLDKNGGAVCFEGIDCFTWGNFTGTTADSTSAPFAALTANKAARRSIAGGVSATLLEAVDDTGNVTADFAAVDPAPKNNNGAQSDGGTTPPVDAGVDSSTPPAKDSGVGTKPSPNNPTVTPDSGTSSTSSGSSSGDDGGCNVTTQSSDGWSTGLGLFAAASMLAMSRRRRNKR